MLNGGEGNDTLNGGASSDVLEGGAGNDQLSGGNYESDTYLFGKGHGQDVINEYASKAEQADTLIFADAQSGHAHFGREGNDLVIKAYGEEDRVAIRHYFYSDSYIHHNLQFADKTLNVEDMKKVTFTFHGTDKGDSLSGWVSDDIIHGGDGNDSVSGRDGNDTLHGESGNDRLYGNNGDDTLNGGAGDDQLDGGYGSDVLDGGAGNDQLSGGNYESDTYRFNKGHGQDVINEYASKADQADTLVFADAQSGHAHFGREGNDLVIKAYGEEDRVAIRHYFYSDSYIHHNLQFADKTLNVEDMKKVTFTFHGTDKGDSLSGWVSDDIIHGGDGNDSVSGRNGNDTLHGESGNDRLYGDNGDDTLNGGAGDDQLDGGYGNDVLNGGEGNDSLSGDYDDDTLDGGTGNDYLGGGQGSDTYLFSKGHGQDTVYDYGDAKDADTVRFADVALSEVTFREENQHLLLSGYHDEDSLRINYFFNNDNYKIERFEFTDQTLTLENIRERAKTQSASNQTQQMVAAMNAFAAEKPANDKALADTKPAASAATADADASVKEKDGEAGGSQAQPIAVAEKAADGKALADTKPAASAATADADASVKEKDGEAGGSQAQPIAVAEKAADGKALADTKPAAPLAATTDTSTPADRVTSGASQAQQMVEAMAAFAPSANVNNTALPDPVQPPVLITTHP